MFEDGPDTPEETRRARAESAGALLARFHKAIADLDLGDFSPRAGLQIVTVSSLGEDINACLLLANDYLQNNKKPGNIHGDFHAGNIMWHGDEARGLIDLSFTGAHESIYSDFWSLPYNRVDDVVKGYERESGQTIQYIVAATELSMLTNMLIKLINMNPGAPHNMAYDPYERVKTLLDKIAPVLET